MFAHRTNSEGETVPRRAPVSREGKPPPSAGLKALAVLESVAVGQPSGVTEVSRALGLPKSTVQRILEDLASAGWVKPDGGAGGGHRRWSTSGRVVAMGLAAAESDDLLVLAPPRLAALRDETEETVHLVLRTGSELFIALCMDSPQPVRTHVEVGARSPFHATSSGIACLAALPDDDVSRILDDGLPRFTDTTPVTRVQVWAEIRAVRERGYAVNPDGWWRSDVFAVAAAVTDGGGAVVAAVTVSAPASRFTNSTAEDLGERVAAVAGDLSESLHLSVVSPDRA